MPGAGRCGNEERLVKGYKLSVIRWVSSEGLTISIYYSMVAIVDKPACIIEIY